MRKFTEINRVIGVLTAVTMGMGILIGCGSNTAALETEKQASAQNVTKQASTENGNEDSNQEPVVLTIVARGGSHTEVIEAVKSEFEQTHNCTIQVLGLEADELKQKVALDSVNPEGAYDLVMVDDPVMPEFMDGNVLLDLTKQGYENDADFLEKSLALGKNPYGEGDTYALPFTGNVQLLFYNEEVLRNIKAEVPETWEDVLAISKQSKEAGSIGYVIRGQQGNPIVSDYLPILWAYGGDVFDKDWNVTVDSDEAKAALQMYCDLLETGANYEKNDIVAAVSDGSAAMALGWPSWFISGTDTQAAYAAVPAKVNANASANSTGMIGNWMMGIPANSQNKEIALELLEYLTSGEVQTVAVEHGGVPTRSSVFQNEEIIAKYPYFTTIYNGTENSVVRPRTAKWSAVEAAYGIELSNVVSGVKTIDEGLADAKTAIEEVMAN